MPSSDRSTRDELGGEQVEGRRAVLELLRAGRRQVRSVAMSRSVRDDPALDEIRTLAGGALDVVASERIDALARSDVPQGVIATVAPLRAADLDELLHVPDAFVVALDGVSDPRNLGAVARVAETAGATGLVLPRHRSARITAVVAKAAAGAIEHLPIVLTGGIPTALERARRGGMLDDRTRRHRRPIAVRPRTRGSTPRPRTGIRRSRFGPADQRSLRGARINSDARRDRFSQRLGRGGARLSRDRPPTCDTTGVTHAGLAQLAEQLTCNQQVIGSIPIPGSREIAGCPTCEARMSRRSKPTMARRRRGACVGVVRTSEQSPRP